MVDPYEDPELYKQKFQPPDEEGYISKKVAIMLLTGWYLKIAEEPWEESRKMAVELVDLIVSHTDEAFVEEGLYIRYHPGKKKFYLTW